MYEANRQSHTLSREGECQEGILGSIRLRRSFLCEKVLKDEGVYANITISEYHLGLIPFDDDVLSLELPNPIF